MIKSDKVQHTGIGLTMRTNLTPGQHRDRQTNTEEVLFYLWKAQQQHWLNCIISAQNQVGNQSRYELSNHQPTISEEGFIDNTILLTQEAFSDAEGFRKNRRARFAPLLNDDEQIFDDDQFIHPDLGGAPPRPELLPSSLAKSPPVGRSSTLPPGNRPVKQPNSRPRKNSVGQMARKPKHERTKSKELHKRLSHDRKAFSAEPQAALFGNMKRWEDLIDAAASATEEDIREREDSRDRTPVRHTTSSLSRNLFNVDLRH